MKLHRPIVAEVLRAVTQVFGTPTTPGYHADKVLERLFQANRKLGARDRRFIAEATYDIVRWWRLLWFCVEREWRGTGPSELWPVFGAWLALTEQPIPDWPELAETKPGLLTLKYMEARRIPAVRHSLPDWLYDLGRLELGEAWDEYLEALNSQAPVVLRANRLKIDREKLQRELIKENIETEIAADTDDGLILKERKNVFSSQAFKLGLFELQDGASQQVAPLLKVEPGDRVVDGCAGAGGKTLHLAALMKNRGKIIALDVHQRKLDELKKRCARAGVDIVEARLIESSKVVKRIESSADRVLLDVPCSGLGVLRRIPDKKWKIQPAEMKRLHELQKEILESNSRIVKSGGRLVYATCSILPSENESQIHAFLSRHSGDWLLVEERRFEPRLNGYDGFYAAVLERC
jgi:16S rRNA (cytosine967-C5)-methyltransferase